MDMKMFIPVYGPSSSMYDILIDEDSSFASKSSAAAQVGVVSALSTVASVAAFGYTQGVVNVARYSPVGTVASAIVLTSSAVSEVVVDQYSKFEPEAPNEKRGFWYMLSGAMNTGLLD